MTKIPITIRVSYDALKQLLKLPDDVDLLGIVGIDDRGGTVPFILETPIHHIITASLSATYRQDDDGTHFTGFR